MRIRHKKEMRRMRRGEMVTEDSRGVGGRGGVERND